MRIINYITCLVLASIVFSSCKKDEEVTPLDPNNPGLETPEPDWKMINPVTLLDLLNIDKITYSNESGTTVSTFHYNSNGKLLKLVEYSKITSGEVQNEFKLVYDFVYQNDTLIRTMRNMNWHSIFGNNESFSEFNHSLEYSYNINGMIDQIRILNDGHEDKIVTREYDIHNRLIKQIIAKDLEILTNYYEWDGNNLVKSTDYHKIKTEDRISKEAFYTDYDNKNNPLCFMSIIEQNNISDYLSQNNVIKGSGKSYYVHDDQAGELAGEWSNDYSYEYNINGQVTKTFNLYNGIITSQKTVSIEYK